MSRRSAETQDQGYIRASLQTAARCRGLSEMSMHLFEPELDGSHRRTEGMLRLMVYSHDSFGLGNIRRMLAICEHLHATIGGVSILIIIASPWLHTLLVPP